MQLYLGNPTYFFAGVNLALGALGWVSTSFRISKPSIIMVPKKSIWLPKELGKQQLG